MSEDTKMVEVVATRPGFYSAKGQQVEKGETFLVPEALALVADQKNATNKPTWFTRLRNEAGEVVVKVEELVEKVEGFTETSLSELGAEMSKMTKGKGWKA